MESTRFVRISSTNQLADSLTAAIDGFLVYCRSKNLSPHTLTYYRTRLAAFRDFLSSTEASSAPKDISRQTVRDFVRSELESRSASTANHSLAVLKAFFRFLIDDGFLVSSPTDGVKKMKQKRSVVQAFTPEQVEAIIGCLAKSFSGIRDKAIALTLFDCGLRASELCGLSLDDVHWSEQTLKVLGKGDRERVVSFGRVTHQALAQYVARRGPLDTDRLFVTVYGGSLDRYGVYRIVKAACRRAEICGVRCSPHTLRHSFAVSYLRSGGDVFSLQKLLGHSDLAMTRRYCETSQTDALEKHRAHSPADRLTPPKPQGGRKRIV